MNTASVLISKVLPLHVIQFVKILKIQLNITAVFLSKSRVFFMRLPKTLNIVITIAKFFTYFHLNLLKHFIG